MKRRMGVLNVFVLACLLLATGVQSSRAADVNPVRVPLQLLPSRHLAVQVRVNGKGPFRLILDTGSPITVLSANAAQRCGIITAQAAKQPALMGMYGFGTVQTLQVGSLQVKNLDVFILDHPIVSLLAQLEGPIDGILGFTFFAHYQTTIDYSAETVQFTPINYEPQNVLANVMSRLMAGDQNRRVVAPAAMWGLVVDKPDAANGVRIARIYEQSAAQAAGLREGDRLLMLDGRWTDTVADCYEAASFVKPGQAVVVRVQRDGKELELPVTPRPGL